MWTAPRTWVDGELVVAPDFNAELRDNQEFFSPVLQGNNIRTPTFNPARFTALAPMVWTVQTSDVVSEAYALQGRELQYLCMLATTTVSGTATNQMFITLPDNLVCSNSGVVMSAFETGGVSLRYEINPGNGLIMILRRDVSNFVLTVDGMWMYFMLCCLVER